LQLLLCTADMSPLPIKSNILTDSIREVILWLALTGQFCDLCNLILADRSASLTGISDGASGVPLAGVP